MSERFFRLILGSSLLLFLYFEWDTLVYVYIGVVTLEGLTNRRIPLLVSRLRYGASFAELPGAERCTAAIDFEGERILRLAIAGFLIVSFVVFHDALWFFPWFIGFALTMAGITGICPMVMLIKKLGFR